jgi:hypothetical protein
VESWFWAFPNEEGPRALAGRREPPEAGEPGRRSASQRSDTVPVDNAKKGKRRTTRSRRGRHRGHRIRAAWRGVRTKNPSSPRPPGRERRRRWPTRGTRGVLCEATIVKYMSGFRARQRFSGL